MRRSMLALVGGVLLFTSGCGVSGQPTVSRPSSAGVATKAGYIESFCNSVSRRHGDRTVVTADLRLNPAEGLDSVTVRLRYGFADQPNTATFQITRYEYEGVDSSEVVDTGTIRRFPDGYSLQGGTRLRFVNTQALLEWEQLGCDVAYESR